MSWISKLVDLFFNNKEIILENVYLFIIFGLTCIGLSLGINKWLNVKTEKKNRDTIDELKEMLEALETENESLKELFNRNGVESRLMAGTDSKPSAPSAKLIANSLNEKTRDK